MHLLSMSKSYSWNIWNRQNLKFLSYPRQKEREETGREKGREEDHSSLNETIFSSVRNLKLSTSPEEESILKCSYFQLVTVGKVGERSSEWDPVWRQGHYRGDWVKMGPVRLASWSKGKRGHRQTRRRRPVKTKSDFGVLRLHLEGVSRISPKHQKEQRGIDTAPSKPQAEAALPTPWATSEPGRRNFY